MTEYHKILTVWKRDPENNYRTLIEDAWACPEFDYLKDLPWVFTEKVDGTNIRVIWEQGKLEFRGKTDRAEIPPFLLDALEELVTPSQCFEVFGDTPAILYGEGFGAKIQKGGKYLPDHQDFALFDVKIDDLWLERFNVKDIGDKLGIRCAKDIGVGSLATMIDRARAGFMSCISETMAEGIVARPVVELTNRRGHRIITKIKTKDFPKEV